MRKIVSARRAFEDEKLLGVGVKKSSSWLPMRSLAIAAMGEELTPEERAHFTKLTGGREHEPMQRVRRFICIAGRRSGKSETAARLAIFQAIMCDHSENLSVGEKGVVLCIAQNQEQAKIVFGYCVGIIQSQPILRKEVANITATTITFKNGIEIQIRSASFRGLRGLTCVACICDETAFWFQEENNSTNSDTEIINAIQPALMTTKGMLIVISSPYARRGVVWQFYNKHFGAKGDPRTLVAQGASRDFNATIDQSEIDAALEEDYSVAQSEWLGQFRTDIESFVSMEAVQACIVPVLEVPPEIGVMYSAFIDASTGAGGDSFAAAIGHLRDGDTMVLDCIRNFKPKFSPESVVTEIADLCHAYGVSTVYSDKYASGFVTELVSKNGLRHEFITLNKSDLYTNLLGVINARKIELLDDKQSINELINLERRTGFAGRDRIDHPQGCHDDSANVIAGLASIVREGLAGGFSMEMFLRAWNDSLPTLEEEKRMTPEQRSEVRKRINNMMRGN